jgi:hypothetical protein
MDEGAKHEGSMNEGAKHEVSILLTLEPRTMGFWN